MCVCVCVCVCCVCVLCAESGDPWVLAKPMPFSLWENDTTPGTIVLKLNTIPDVKLCTALIFCVCLCLIKLLLLFKCGGFLTGSCPDNGQ